MRARTGRRFVTFFLPSGGLIFEFRPAPHFMDRRWGPLWWWLSAKAGTLPDQPWITRFRIGPFIVDRYLYGTASARLGLVRRVRSALAHRLARWGRSLHPEAFEREAARWRQREADDGGPW